MYVFNIFTFFENISNSYLWNSLKKLGCYWIRGFILEWLKFYLADRFLACWNSKHKVKYEKCLKGSSAGLYSGSTLKFTDLKLVDYADDCMAYTSNNALDHLSEHVDCELSKNSDWLCAHRISLNVAKSSFSIYSYKKKFKLHQIS